MEPDGLEAQKDEFNALLKEVVDLLKSTKRANRPAAVRSLVLSAISRGELTYSDFVHTEKEENSDGQKLVASGTYTRGQVKDFLRSSCFHPIKQRATLDLQTYGSLSGAPRIK